MVISHTYKYLFVELPHTASSSISRELRGYYDGHSILKKHSRYHDFLKQAGAEEKKYFVFSSIRNPLDIIVTQYFRYKNDPEDNFKKPGQWKRNGGFITKRMLRRARFLEKSRADFSAFFKKFYNFPYVDWSNLAHRKFDFIIRYESLQEDFSRLLKELGIEQRRPLPRINITAGKNENFWSYYTPEIRKKALRTGGPFMRRWGYKFPPEWGDVSAEKLAELEFRVIDGLKRTKWRYWG